MYRMRSSASSRSASRRRSVPFALVRPAWVFAALLSGGHCAALPAFGRERATDPAADARRNSQSSGDIRGRNSGRRLLLGGPRGVPAALSRQRGRARIESLQLGRGQAAATAMCHSVAASIRKIRRMDREMRWRCRLKVFWTAACMLRKRWAERADLNRCSLRSRHRTA